MNRKALVLFFGIILLFQAASVEATTRVSEFTSSKEKAGEGSAVDFSVIVEGAAVEPLEFEWDYGDGVKALTSESASSHAYYLEGLEGEREFTVRVRVKGVEGLLGEESLNVLIKRSEFKPKLLQPLPVPEGALEKGGEHSILFLFLDAFGQEVPFERIIEFGASIKGQEIDLNRDEKGFLIGNFQSGNDFRAIEKIEIEAKIQGMERKEFSLPAFFNPLEIRVEEPFIEDYYFNSLIGGIAFNLSLPDGSVPEKGEFTAIILSGEKTVGSSELSFKDKEWIADFDYRVSGGDLKEGLGLVVFGGDGFGNTLERKGFMVPIRESRPEFDVVLVKPFAEGSLALGFGQLVEFAARVNSTRLDSLEKIEIVLESRDSGVKSELEGQEHDFRAMVRMPEEGESELMLSLIGSAELEGQEVHSFEEIQINLSREVGIEFIYPLAGTSVKKDGGRMRLRLSYPNGESLEKESVNALLSVDGEQFEVVLLLDREKALYYCDMPAGLAGLHELGIELREPFEGRAEITANIVEPINWPLVLGLVIVVLLALFLAYSALSRAKHKKEEKNVLEMRIGEIDREVKRAEGNYYKRRLTDSELRERVLKLEEEKAIIRKKLKLGKEKKD